MKEKSPALVNKNILLPFFFSALTGWFLEQWFFHCWILISSFLVVCTGIMVLKQSLCSNDGKAMGWRKHSEALVFLWLLWNMLSTDFLSVPVRLPKHSKVLLHTSGSVHCMWNFIMRNTGLSVIFFSLFNRDFLPIPLGTLFCLTTSSHTVFTPTLTWTFQMLSKINSYFDSRA